MKPVPVVLGCAFWMTLAGCAKPDRGIERQVYQGEFGRASATLSATLEKVPTRRTYLYDRMELAMLDLADGRPEIATQTVDEVFDVLRTQGMNQDRTVACFVTTEKLGKFWKGEPFEQAMMFTYIAMQKAMSNEWDNARAASLSSLFMLTDFGLNQEGNRKSAQEITKAAAQREKEARKNKEDVPDGVSAGYTPADTDFALGYLMAGISNAVLGAADPDRAREADEQYAKALEVNAGLQSVVDALQPNRYNTILIVDYGLGPTKYRYGMDGVYSGFAQRRGFYSGDEPLHVTVNGRQAATSDYPPVCDLNTMAADHRWNNLEQLRVAKSYIGTGMVVGGAVASYFNSYAGYGVGAVGAAMKASAKADITYCPIMPQRVYVAPILVTDPGTTLDLQAGDDVNSHLVLVDLSPPQPPQRVQLRYVRLVPGPPLPAWATSGQMLYDNDFAHCPADPTPLPYILGGHCVCRPSHEVLLRYQQAGFLQGLTLERLGDLYRAEGIKLEEAGSDAARGGAHVLEGGASLECPLPGTTGYARLFGQEHPAYRPKSKEVSELAAKLRGQVQPVASARP
jgi:hypothetical protein